MSEINRSNDFVRSEKGGEWFQDFIESLAADKSGHTQDVLDAIQDKRGESVQSVVDNYREMVGLYSVVAENNEDEIKVKASAPISIRCSKEDEPDIIMIIEKDPNIKRDIDSLCQHSGGHKGTHSIINFLREKLGKDLVSYSNEDLVQYVEDTKNRYKIKTEEPYNEIGMIGTENLDNIDETADYMMHNKGS